jgi:hypothetical protein
MNLIEAWQSWASRRLDQPPPFLLDQDRWILQSERSKRAISPEPDDRRDPFQDPMFCPRGDTRLHLGLLPMPYFGDLGRASVYLLMLNPGVGGPDSYHGEWSPNVPEYRAGLIATLTQQPRPSVMPFMFLDPQFDWHDGTRYWYGKLQKVIHELARVWDVPIAAARTHCGSVIACLQLLPYRSLAFKDSDGWLRKPLESVRLARSFVREDVLPRVESGEAIAVVLRAVKRWELPEGMCKHTGVVCYGAGEARGAHLGPNGRGGSLILKHLRDRRPTTRRS